MYVNNCVASATTTMTSRRCLLNCATQPRTLSLQYSGYRPIKGQSGDSLNDDDSAATGGCDDTQGFSNLITSCFPPGTSVLHYCYTNMNWMSILSWIIWYDSSTASDRVLTMWRHVFSVGQMKHAFVLVQISRFQQIIGVYTLQASSEATKVVCKQQFTVSHTQ